MERPHKEIRTYNLWLKLENKSKVSRKLGGMARTTVDAHIKKAEAWDDYCQTFIDEYLLEDPEDFPDEMPDDAYDIIMAEQEKIRKQMEINEKLILQLEKLHEEQKNMPKYPGCVDASEEAENWFRSIIEKYMENDFHGGLKAYANDMFEDPGGRKQLLNVAAVWYLNDNYCTCGISRQGVMAKEAWGWDWHILDGHTNRWNPNHPEDKERWERTWSDATETGLIDLDILYAEYGGDNNE